MRFEAAEWAVVPLSTPSAADPALTGAKAAHPARAAEEELPVLPGFVLVPATRTRSALTGDEALRGAWRTLAGEDGREPLVVRSSSLHEDTENSSMAGRFDSVLDVRGWDDFVAAVRTVLSSVRRVRPLRPASQDLPDDGMAVLVQPMLTSAVGGVMFGADPIEGRTDRVLVNVVGEAPTTSSTAARGALDPGPAACRAIRRPAEAALCPTGRRASCSRAARVREARCAAPPQATLLGWIEEGVYWSCSRFSGDHRVGASGWEAPGPPRGQAVTPPAADLPPVPGRPAVLEGALSWRAVHRAETSGLAAPASSRAPISRRP
ncbi:PEP/pyruvate-binding domain-containing protein [Streptomyces nigra]|uniref:PEP/pyruvate-binding domain-containing protein n=1 Tax=Streptomyces nigra TaxID=1827580 RepID=UPI0036C0A01E